MKIGDEITDVVKYWGSITSEERIYVLIKYFVQLEECPKELHERFTEWLCECNVEMRDKALFRVFEEYCHGEAGLARICPQ